MKRWLITLLVLAGVAGLALAPLPFDDTTRIRNSVSLSKDPEAVFAYVTTPANWPKWHPSSIGVSGPADHQLGDRLGIRAKVETDSAEAVWRLREVLESTAGPPRT